MDYVRVNMHPVTDKRTLKMLAKRGHFTFPARFGGSSCQIDYDKQPNHFKAYIQSYDMEIEFEIRFVDGSIYPILFMRKPKFGNTCKYGYYY